MSPKAEIKSLKAKVIRLRRALEICTDPEGHSGLLHIGDPNSARSSQCITCMKIRAATEALKENPL